VYSLPIPAERVSQVEAAASALLAELKVWVERLRPSAKRLNIRPYVRGLGVKEPNPPTPFPGKEGGAGLSDALSPSPLGGGVGEGSAFSPSLHLDLWVTQDGTARAEELLARLGIADLIDSGAVLERTTLEIRDEITATQPGDVPPDGHADSVPLTGTEVAALTARLHAEESEQPAEAGWGASPNGPVVE
jgi:hypothetical protein